MYSILMDANTKSYYMEPGDVAFHAYTDPSMLDVKRRSSRLVETDMEDVKELETLLYNAGFFHGYLNGQPYKLSKQKIYYYDRNPNEISYAQYLLTKDRKYLELIKKQKLYTLCQTDGLNIYFPTVRLDSGEVAVLTYTDKSRMPRELLEKYAGWRSVRMSFDARCVVNGCFVAE